MVPLCLLASIEIFRCSGAILAYGEAIIATHKSAGIADSVRASQKQAARTHKKCRGARHTRGRKDVRDGQQASTSTYRNTFSAAMHSMGIVCAAWAEMDAIESL